MKCDQSVEVSYEVIDMITATADFPLKDEDLCEKNQRREKRGESIVTLYHMLLQAILIDVVVVLMSHLFLAIEIKVTCRFFNFCWTPYYFYLLCLNYWTII